MKTKTFLFTSALMAFGLFFCGISRHDANVTALATLASSKQFDCVGKAMENGKSIGSGVLISSKYVLSATHVLMTANQMFNKKRKLSQLDPADFSFDFGGNTFRVVRIITYPDSRIDLVLLELDRQVTKISFAELNTKFDEMGSEVTGVGFGVSGTVNDKGVLKTQQTGIKSAGRNTIDKFSGLEQMGKPSMMQLDFDSPSDPGVNKMGIAKPIEMEYTPAGGDSGGGLFRTDNGKTELIGILHSTQGDIENFRKNGYYGEVSNWTRVSVFSSWIKSSIAE